MISVRRDLDEIIVRGRLTEPRTNRVTRRGEDGQPEEVTVANLTVVVNRSYRQPDGTYKEVPYYYEFSVWGEQADRYLASNMFVKGTNVMVRGMPNWETYTKGDGTTGVRVKIEAPPGGRIELFMGERPAGSGSAAVDDGGQDEDSAPEPPRRTPSMKPPQRPGERRIR